MKLVEKYRPRTLAELVGQPYAVETVARLAQRADPPPLLLTGPYGTGKTTLARIFARALNCTALTPTGSPCLHCASCALFGTGDEAWIYTEVAAGVTGEKDHARYIHELAHTQPLLDVAYRVILLDEAHLLTTPAQETLLAVLEKPTPTVFVLATTEPSRLVGALRSRCQRVPLRLVSTSELIAHGRWVCAQEGIVAEPGALALLAHDAEGHVRNFVMSLEQFTAGGALRLAAVANGLDLAWAELALRTVLALAHGDCCAAKRTLRRWTATPDRKADALRDALLHAAHVGFMPAGVAPEASAAFALAPPALVDEVVVALRGATGGFGVQPLAYVWGLAQQWSRAASLLRNEGDLELELVRAAYALSPSDPRLPELPLAPVSAPPRRVRRARTQAAKARTPKRRGGSSELLTAAQVRGVYRAATMLPQLTGLWFNVRLCVPFGAYGETDFARAMKWLSDLKRAWRLRLRDWTGDEQFVLHFVQQNEVDAAGHSVAWLLVHVPPACVDQSCAWVTSQLPLRAGELVPTLDAGVWRAPAHGRPADVHWSLVRDLWRAADPDLTVQAHGRAVSLKEALGVPVQGPRKAGVLPDKARRCSTSDELSGPAWTAAYAARFGFVCAFALARWDVLARGWELDEWEHRRTEAARRAEEVARLEALFPPGRDAATDLTREQKVRAFNDSLPFDATKRPRARPLW